MSAALDDTGTSAHPIRERVLSAPWDYPEADTQQLTHNIHRYSGKFIPQIAQRAIKILTNPGDLVVDPYCGSGTVLLESALLGRRAVGIDLNPLAVLISKTKTTVVPLQERENLKCNLSNVVKVLEEGTQLSFWQNGGGSLTDDSRLFDEWFTKWFGSNVLRDLVAIHNEISKVRNVSARNLAMVAFSDILRRCSNAHSGYPNVMFDRKAPRKAKPGRVFLKSLDRVCDMVQSLESVSADWKSVQVHLGDARKTGVPGASASAVITHPPYIGSIPYAEYGLLSLKWLGADPKVLDQQLTGGRRQSADVVSRFRASYSAMFHEVQRILKPGGFAFLMVGDPIVKGELVDLAGMTRRLAEDAGLTLVVETRRNGINRRANKMGSESLLFFQKREHF